MTECVNKAILVGHLDADPVVKRTKDDKLLVTFTLVTTETWRNKDGGERHKLQFHKIAIFHETLAKRRSPPRFSMRPRAAVCGPAVSAFWQTGH
jgi:hypothetical protein